MALTSFIGVALCAIIISCVVQFFPPLYATPALVLCVLIVVLVQFFFRTHTHTTKWRKKVSQTTKERALRSAAKNGHIDDVKRLLNSGVNRNAVDKVCY